MLSSTVLNRKGSSKDHPECRFINTMCDGHFQTIPDSLLEASSVTFHPLKGPNFVAAILKLNGKVCFSPNSWLPKEMVLFTLIHTVSNHSYIFNIHVRMYI